LPAAPPLRSRRARTTVSGNSVPMRIARTRRGSARGPWRGRSVLAVSPCQCRCWVRPSLHVDHNLMVSEEKYSEKISGGTSLNQSIALSNRHASLLPSGFTARIISLIFSNPIARSRTDVSHFLGHAGEENRWKVFSTLHLRAWRRSIQSSKVSELTTARCMGKIMRVHYTSNRSLHIGNL
jgi:hypothetical protein